MSRRLIEQSIMHLLRSDFDIDNGVSYAKGKRFYGYFISSMRKHYDTKGIDTLAVNITDQINLYINTEFFKSCTPIQRVEVLEHECKHIIYNHLNPRRIKNLTNQKDAMLWNYATDAVINEPLKSLHEQGITIAKLKEKIPDLEYNQSAEYYYAKLKEYAQKNGNKGEGDIKESGDTIDDHSAWGKNDDLTEPKEGEGKGGSQIEQIGKEMVKKAMKDAIEKCNGRANVPIEIMQALDSLNKATVNWKQQLKQFFSKADKYSKEPTRKKRNRRYGHMMPGKRKKPMTHICVAIDESGSVSNDLHKQFFSEIDVAARLDNIKFTIIHADCQINRVYEYVPGMKIERTGCGGTEYMPAINKAIELKSDGMIYFGDGDIFGEKLVKPRMPFLWAMEDGRNAPVEWGKVCHVKYNEKN
jgi:predicted metal-dependent peptidase